MRDRCFPRMRRSLRVLVSLEDCTKVDAAHAARWMALKERFRHSRMSSCVICADGEKAGTVLGYLNKR